MWEHLQSLLVEAVGAGIGGAIAARLTFRRIIRFEVRTEIAPIERRVTALELRPNVAPTGPEEALSHG